MIRVAKDDLASVYHRIQTHTTELANHNANLMHKVESHVDEKKKDQVMDSVDRLTRAINDFDSMLQSYARDMLVREWTK